MADLSVHEMLEIQKELQEKYKGQMRADMSASRKAQIIVAYRRNRRGH